IRPWCCKSVALGSANPHPPSSATARVPHVAERAPGIYFTPAAGKKKIKKRNGRFTIQNAVNFKPMLFNIKIKKKNTPPKQKKKILLSNIL
ncbi:hypothetical protein ACVGWI_08640, partial [Enterobacter hormaechei]